MRRQRLGDAAPRRLLTAALTLFAAVVLVPAATLPLSAAEQAKAAPDGSAPKNDGGGEAAQDGGATKNPGAAKKNDAIRVPHPSERWELQIPVGGFEVTQDDDAGGDDETAEGEAGTGDAENTKDDKVEDGEGKRPRQFTAVNKQTGLIVSVFMEPAAKKGDSKVAREVYWGRTQADPFPKEQVKRSESGDKALVEYTVPEVGGKKVNQKNLHLYFVHEGVWVDAHVSKVDYTEKDRPAFDAIVKGAKIVDGATGH
jgi:hypothetical protein